MDPSEATMDLCLRRSESAGVGRIMTAGHGFLRPGHCRIKVVVRPGSLVVCQLAHKPVLFGCYTRECFGFRCICAESKPTSNNMAAESASRGG